MKATDLAPLSNIIIYVDMDGVIVDSYSHIGQLYGVGKTANLTPEQGKHFWDNVEAVDYFSNLPEFPTTNQLLSIATEYAGKYTLLTSPLNTDEAGSIEGKKIWLSKHSNIKPAGVIYETAKEQYAVTNGIPNVLIDDSGSNIKKWNAAGGIGISYRGEYDSLDVVIEGLNNAVQIIRNLENEK